MHHSMVLSQIIWTELNCEKKINWKKISEEQIKKGGWCFLHLYICFCYEYSTLFQIHNIVTWHQIIKSEFTFDYFHDNFHIKKKTWNAKTLTQICLWFRVLFRHPAVVIVIRRGEGMLSPRHLPSLSLNITKRGDIYFNGL